MAGQEAIVVNLLLLDGRQPGRSRTYLENFSTQQVTFRHFDPQILNMK
jgi:hypothetical protein